MFCGQCGKRVLDSMLFCPFCGAPIVIPDQDGSAAPAPGAGTATLDEMAKLYEEDAAPAAPEAAPAPEPEAPAAPEAALAPAAEAPVEEVPEEPEAAPVKPAPAKPAFEPLHFDAPKPEDVPALKRPSAPERPQSLFDDVPAAGDAQEPPKRTASTPAKEAPKRPQPPQRRPEGGAKAARPSYIPVKDVDPKDMFMDAEHPPIVDDFDLFDEDEEEDEFDDGFPYEEPEPVDFLQRHIRGVVGLVLLAMVIVIFLIWAAMPQGQQTLATFNLAWSPKAYDDLGHEAYEAGQYSQAAEYFKSALSRDENNYEYAHSAMVAYYEAKDSDAALAMLKQCIRMNPDSAEPYHELMILYPDAASRPFEVTELLRDGYVRTGDESLKPADAEDDTQGGAIQGTPMVQ